MKNKSGKSLSKYFGALKDTNIDWKAKEIRMRAFRESFNKHGAETRRKMELSRNDRP